MTDSPLLTGRPIAPILRVVFTDLSEDDLRTLNDMLAEIFLMLYDDLVAHPNATPESEGLDRSS